jgi:hypothetical protein
MASFVHSAFFQVTIVPLLLMVIGMEARRLGRRDGDDSPRRNDWAVGTTLLLMLLGTVLGDLRTAQGSTGDLLMWLIGVLCMAFVSVEHDRFKSWVRDAAGIPTREKRLWMGVAGPTFLSFVVFVAYQYWKTMISSAP